VAAVPEGRPNINDLMFLLQAAKPGTEVKITFIRDGKLRR
jgi:hypothetical protein